MVRYPKIVELTPWMVDEDVSAPVSAPPDNGRYEAKVVVRVLSCVCTLDVKVVRYPKIVELTPWMVDEEVTAPVKVPPDNGNLAATEVVRVSSCD